MRKACVGLISLVCLCAFSLAALAGEPSDPVSVQTRLKRVALFKNGLGFFVREGTLQGDAEVALLGPFAAPSHGTFWVSCAPRAGLRSVTARHVKGTEEVPACDMSELLRANVGKRVTIRNDDGFGPGITGTIIAFAPGRAPERPPPYLIGGQPDRSRGVAVGQGRFVLLQTDDGVLALNLSYISSLQFADSEIERNLVQEVERFELEASLARPTPGDWLSVSYLAKGITWAPSYLIDVSEQETARLTAKAVIINEAEDLDAAHVDLITGFPNLQFADITSPMSMRQDLASFLQSLAGRPHRPTPAGIVTQTVVSAGAESAFARNLPDYAAPDPGFVAEDLFLYPIENITLARGETGYYPLFTEAVPYTEFHRWEIPDYVTQEDRYGQQRREERDKPEEVWHSLRLTNTTAVPWTTAPAHLTKDGQIIGQSTLTYTPPKGRATVKVTKAVSVKVEQSEVEVEREREALRMYGYDFDRVTLEGKLSVTNFKQKAISLEIAKTLSGDVQSINPEAKDVTLARGLRRMNPTHRLTWKLDLDPGEHKEIGYTYEVLIRR